MIPTWGTSTGRNVVGGVPSLLLDFSSQSYFLNGTGYAAFDASPGITFSRGTNATLIDSTGQLTFAPSNMLLNSESFGSTSWTLGGTTIPTVSSNVVVAPDGTTTADAVTFPSTSSLIRQNPTGAIVGVNYSISVWLKTDTPKTLRLLSNSSPTSVIASTLCSVTTEWQRFSLVRVCPVGANSVSLQVDSSGGAEAGTYYMWGAQLGAVTYETEPRTYNSTTPKNLLGFTEEFNNAVWVKPNVTITANSVADPNGNLNADTLSATVGNATVFQNISLLAAPYTFSIWLKRKNGTGNINITINGVTFITQAVTDDWTRFSTTLTPSAGTKNIGVQIVTLGDEVYAWGAQVSDSASLDPYVYNPAAALTSTAYYGPRFDYDPITLSPLGLLIEEARTNLMFPSDVTGWSMSPASIVAITSNSAISPDGTTNATKLTTNDATLADRGYAIFKLYTGAVSTTYCGSAYLKAGEYTRAQINFENTSFLTATGALFDLANGTVVVTGGSSTATITPVGNGWYRCTVTATSLAISGNYVFSASFKPASVTTFNSTYTPISTGLGGYIYGAQVEAGGFATSFIPTVSAAATRSADVATMVGNNFINWYNQTTGTLSVAFDASANSNATYVSASNGSIVQNSIHIDNDTGNMRAVYYSGSAEVAALVLGAIGTAGTANKIATAYAVNDFAASRNGGTVATDTSGALPVSLTQLNIGVDDRLSAIYYTSNHIKSISYYNTRLTNAQLQAVSA
jgi:hypothetical protein